MSHIGTPEWQSFELRMRERARLHRAAKRRRRVRHLATGMGFVTLAALAGVYVGAGAAYLEIGGTYPGLGPDSLQRYFELLNAPQPAVRRPGQPFTPRGVVAPPLPSPMFDQPLSDQPVLEQPVLEEAPDRGSTPAAEPTTAAAIVAPRASRPRENAAIPVSRPSTARPRAIWPPPEPRPTPSPPLQEEATVVATSGYTGVAPPPVEPLGVPPERARTAAETPPGPATAPPVIDQRPTIRETIERYRTAYERLDAAGARAVWPGVEEAALARAFESLRSQRLMFENCSIDVAGSTATASCRGTARVVPRIGGGTEAVRRSWNFRLRQSGDRWLIESTQIK